MTSADGTINYAYGVIDQGVTEILQATNQINNYIEQLKANVQSVTSDQNWTGSSAADYKVKAANITQQLQSMSSTLSSSGRTVSDLANQTQEMDRKSSTMFQ